MTKVRTLQLVRFSIHQTAITIVCTFDIFHTPQNSSSKSSIVTFISNYFKSIIFEGCIKFTEYFHFLYSYYFCKKYVISIVYAYGIEYTWSFNTKTCINNHEGRRMINVLYVIKRRWLRRYDNYKLGLLPF